ncbi:hypothetical protein MBLNU230_g2171t1 [Neophaeotheca triangularis]
MLPIPRPLLAQRRHVCLTCRYRQRIRALEALRFGRQLHTSPVAHSDGNTSTEKKAHSYDPAQEDWFANFNDLSTKLPTKESRTKGLEASAKKPHKEETRLGGAPERDEVSDGKDMTPPPRLGSRRRRRLPVMRDRKLSKVPVTSRERPRRRGESADQDPSEEAYDSGGPKVAFLDLKKALAARRDPAAVQPVEEEAGGRQATGSGIVEANTAGPTSINAHNAASSFEKPVFRKRSPRSLKPHPLPLTSAEYLNENDGSARSIWRLKAQHNQSDVPSARLYQSQKEAEEPRNTHFEEVVKGLGQEMTDEPQGIEGSGFEEVVTGLQAELARRSNEPDSTSGTTESKRNHLKRYQPISLEKGSSKSPGANVISLDSPFSRMFTSGKPSQNTPQNGEPGIKTNPTTDIRAGNGQRQSESSLQERNVKPTSDHANRPIFSFGDHVTSQRPRGKTNVVDDVDARRDRPAWGGLVDTGPVVADKVTISYDSLRAADAVSRHPAVPTKVNDRPWGLEAETKDDKFADSPAELSEREVVRDTKDGAKSTPESKNDEEDEGGSWLKRSFRSLKRGWFGSSGASNAHQPHLTLEEARRQTPSDLPAGRQATEQATPAAEAKVAEHDNMPETRETHSPTDPQPAQHSTSKPDGEETRSTEVKGASPAHGDKDGASETLATLHNAQASESVPSPQSDRQSPAEGGVPSRSGKDGTPPLPNANGNAALEHHHGFTSKKTSKEVRLGLNARVVMRSDSIRIFESARRARKNAKMQALKQGRSLNTASKLSLFAYLHALEHELSLPETALTDEKKNKGDSKPTQETPGSPSPFQTSMRPNKHSAKPTDQVQADSEPNLHDVVAVASSESSSTESILPNQEQVDTKDPNSETEQSDFKSQLLTIDTSSLHVEPLDIEQPPVPALSYGLDRVLFNPGVYQLQDPHSKVYNFDPYLQKIMPVMEFDFNALKEYKSSSQDTFLADLAREHSKKYVGSTSSMTATLAHFHFLLSDWRGINTDMLSQSFPTGSSSSKFTTINRAPNAIFLRHKKDSNTYAIDADKQYDSGNVLMMLGKSMEKLLTMPSDEYERYRKSDPRSVSEEERNAPEAFQFTTMGDFLMRSQLDAHDPRLPGTGMFDLKTRAVLTVRMDAQDFEPMLGYEIHKMQGKFESYEREYYDMIRSTMLKYMLQVRMGRMDGIFVAYHNVQRIFGFQYLPVSEMDRALHGQTDPCLGDQEFKASLRLLNETLERATQRFPGQSLRMQFETRENPTAMYVFAEPMEDEEIEKLQAAPKEKLAKFEKEMMGLDREEREPPKTDDSATASEEQATETASSDTAPGPEDDTTSSADTAYMETLAASIETASTKPLYAATLMTRSYVNGNEENISNKQLRPKDTWEIESLIKEIKSPRDAWALYEASKARRKEALDREREEELDAEGVPTGARKVDSYIQMLRDMAKDGRKFRGKLDEAEERTGRKRVVVGEEVGEAKGVEGVASGPGVDAGVDDDALVGSARTVEGYMDWLYKKE